MKAIIIGAGIAGLSTAIALWRHGIDFELYERAERLTEVGAGISLWCNALDVLDRLAVPIRDISQPLEQTELRLNRGLKKTSLFLAKELSNLLEYSPPLVMVHRAELVDLLTSCVPPEKLHFGHELSNLEQTGAVVRASFKNNTQATADVLIAADGIKSVVREHIQGPRPLRYSGYTCFRGVSPRPQLIQPAYMGEWWGRGMRFGITTLPRDRIYWFATCNSPLGSRHTTLAQDVRQMFSGWAEPIPEILATTPDTVFLHNDIVDRPPNPRQHQGRVVLIGDAAHPTTPNLGQGGCMAIEDSLALAKLMVGINDPGNLEEQLRKFVGQRQVRTSTIVRQSYRLGAIAQWQSPIASTMRDWLVSIIASRLGPNELIKHARYRVP